MTNDRLPTDLDVDLPELLRRARFGRDGYTAMRRQGRTPRAFRVGRKLWFSESEVQRWLLEERIQPEPVAKKGPSVLSEAQPETAHFENARRVWPSETEPGP